MASLISATEYIYIVCELLSFKAQIQIFFYPIVLLGGSTGYIVIMNDKDFLVRDHRQLYSLVSEHRNTI